MDKEKEICDMAEVINVSVYGQPIGERTLRTEIELAMALQNAGYCNVKQAVKEFAEKIENLCREHEKRYSHLCKSKKEFHDETCRYQAVLRLHKEITELYGVNE